MYLLIPKTGCGYVRLEQNLHPTMYLLIHVSAQAYIDVP